MFIERVATQPIDLDLVIPAIRRKVIEDRLISHPGFQTHDISHIPELRPIVSSFRKACGTLGYFGKRVLMWAYCETRERQQSFVYDDLWHNHNEGQPVISGVMYLLNPENIGTEFESLGMCPGDCWIWNLFPSDLRHRPGQLHTNDLRVAIAADLRND